MFENSPYCHSLQEADQKKLMGQHHEAIMICEEILCDDLECNEALEEIGDNFLSLKDFPKAIKALKQAKRVNPKSANAHYLLGFAYSGINEWKESIYELEVADSLEPNHPEILRCLGWSVYHYGEKERGLVLLKRAAHMSPDDIFILCDLGVCYLNNRAFNEAESIFNKVLELEPGHTKARECLKACSYFRGE